MDIEKIKNDFPNIDFNKERILILETLEKNPCFLNILGKAGSGKSATLNFLKQYLESKGKNVVVCATTGVASALLNSENLDMGATTIHSTFLIKAQDLQGNFSPSNIHTSNERREQLENLISGMDYLFIDESSMITSDLFDYLIEEIQYFRYETLPNIILFGDIFQLPPVVKMNDPKIRNYYKGYFNNKVFYYNSHKFKDLGFKTIILEKIYRQKDDLEFTEILNRIRIGQTTQADLDRLNTRVVSEDDQINWDLDNDDSVRLCTTNKDCDIYNKLSMDALDSEWIKIPSVITGNFLYSDEFKSGLYPQELELKLGAKVMITRNAPSDEDGNRAYVNGSVGILEDINDGIAEVRLKNGIVYVQKEKVSHYEYEVEKDEDNKICVESNEKGSWTNLPLRINFARTIHKSQGTTLDKGIIDLGHWVAESGVYVALSRFRHLTDFILTKPIKMADIKVCKESKEFLNNLS